MQQGLFVAKHCHLAYISTQCRSLTSFFKKQLYYTSPLFSPQHDWICDWSFVTVGMRGGRTCSICRCSCPEDSGKGVQGSLPYPINRWVKAEEGQRWCSFPLSPSLPLLPFVCLPLLHVCVRACVSVLLLANSRSMLLIDSCGWWAAQWRRGQSSNEFLHLMPLALTPTPVP